MKQKTCAEILAETGEKIDKSPVLKAACIYSDSVKKPSTIYGYGKVGLIEAFKSGAEWQAKQSPWISVEERMPTVGTVVLTKGAYGYLICFLSTFGEWETGAHVNEELLGITHWMPIPKINE